MARLSDMPPNLAEHLQGLACPDMGVTPAVGGIPLSQQRVAIISTAGLSRRGDDAFTAGAADYRVIPADLPTSDLTMSHISVNYDRTGFQDDVNIAFPIDRLKELVAAGQIGSVADFHYSFMGATDPIQMKPAVDSLLGPMLGEGVTAAILIPV